MSALPPLSTVPWTFTLKEAQALQLKNGNPLLVSIKKYGKRGFAFSSCASAEDFEADVKKWGDSFWINEVVSTPDHAALLGALGIRTQPPRFALDLDREAPDGPEHDAWNEEVAAIKDALQVVVRNITGNEEYQNEFIELDGSREYTRGAYKHSLHLISKNISMKSFVTGTWLCDAIEDELTRRGLECSIIDRKIYSKNRSFRVIGSKKEARGRPLESKSAVSFAESLITLYDHDTILLSESQPWASKNPRKRSSASSVSHEEKRLRCDCSIAKKLQNFLDNSPVSKAWMWEGAEVQVVFEGSGNYIYFQVGFREKAGATCVPQNSTTEIAHRLGEYAPKNGFSLHRGSAA